MSATSYTDEKRKKGRPALPGPLPPNNLPSTPGVASYFAMASGARPKAMGSRYMML
jgi:hypothetical protein